MKIIKYLICLVLLLQGAGFANAQNPDVVKLRLKVFLGGAVRGGGSSAPVTPETLTFDYLSGNPGTDATPKIKLKNVKAGAQVTLYKGEETCIGAGVNVSVDEKGRFDVPSELEAEGYKTHYYYVKQTLNGKSSVCSDLNAYERSLLVEPDLSVASENPSTSATPALKIANLEVGAAVALYKGSKDEPCSGTAYSMVLDENKKFEVPAELEASYGDNYYSAQQIVDGAIPPCSKTVEYIRGLLITPSLSLVDDSPGTDLRPTLKVTSLEPGATITLHKGPKDEPCSGTGSEVSVDEKGRFKVSSDLETSHGDNYYSVRQTLDEKVSPCSVVVEYVRNLIIPNISLVSGSPGADATPILKITNLEMGAMITLYKDAACSGTSFDVAIGEGGRFEVPTDLEAIYGDNQYSAKQMLSDGESPPCSEVVSYVRSLLVTPNLSLVGDEQGTDATPTLKITNLEIGTVIVLYKDAACSGTAFNVTIGERGKFNVPSDLETSLGDNYYSAQQIVDGETPPCSEAVRYVRDLLSTPGLSLLSESPGLARTPTLKVTNLETDATVTLYKNNSCSGVGSNVSLDEKGRVTVPSNLETSHGDNYYSVQQTVGEKVSSCSEAVEYVRSLLTTPNLILVSETPGTDLTPTLKVTNLETDATVTLYKSSSCSGAGSDISMDEKGRFDIPSDLETSYGDNSYSVKQTVNGQSSPCSTGVYYLRNFATLNLSLLSESPGTDTTPTLKVTNLETDATVTLYKSDSCSGTGSDVSVDEKGRFDVPSNLEASSGDNYYFVEQTVNGQSSPCSGAVLYTRNLMNTELSLISESPGTDDTPTLKVTNLETDATVTLYKNNSCSGAGFDVSVDEKGRFTVPDDLETSYGGNYYSVKQTVGEQILPCSNGVYYVHSSPSADKWQRWSDDALSGGINIKVSEFFSDGLSTLGGMMGAWNNSGSDINYTFFTVPSTTVDRLIYDNGDSYNEDSTMGIYSNKKGSLPLSSKVLARVYLKIRNKNVGTPYEHGEIYSADIIVNAKKNDFTYDSSNSDAYDLPSVILHALGHFLGLKNTGDDGPSSAMKEISDTNTVFRAITIYDKESIEKRYGGENNPPPSQQSRALEGSGKEETRTIYIYR